MQNLFLKSILFLTLIILMACGEVNKIPKEDYETLPLDEKINYIYSVFPDTSTVSRMTLALPDNIEKIKDSKLTPSPKFIERIDEINNFYIDTDFNNAKTLREFDPDFSWYDKVWDMDSLYGWYWFWGILLALIILSAVTENGTIFAIISVFYLVCGVLSFISFSRGKPIEEEPYPSFVPVSTELSSLKPSSIQVDTEKPISLQNDSIITEVENTKSKEFNIPEEDSFSSDEPINKSPGQPIPSDQNYIDFTHAYDEIILQGVNLDNLSSMVSISPEELINIRYGKIKVPAALAEVMAGYSDSLDEGEEFEFEPWKEKLSDIVYDPSGFMPDKEFVRLTQLNRNLRVEEYLAIVAAQYYSQLMDDYLDREFGFFSSIWQGIKYIFTSKEKYGESFEKGISELLNDKKIDGVILDYINNYKHTLEKEQFILFGSKETVADFKEIILDSKLNPMTDEIKEKLIERGSLEALDIAYSAMEAVILWVISWIVLSIICTRLIKKKEEEQLLLHGLIGKFNPKSTWGKIGKFAAEVGTDLFYGNQKAKIREKYERYITFANIIIPILSYGVTYFFIILPAIDLEIEINQLLTQEFIEYYQSNNLPVTALLNNISESL